MLQKYHNKPNKSKNYEECKQKYYPARKEYLKTIEKPLAQEEPKR
jgi:hypothetical protein